MTNHQPQKFYVEPGNTRMFVACELACGLGILGGIGTIPLLLERLPLPFWIVEATFGVLVVTNGFYYLECGVPRLLNGLKNLKNLWKFIRRAPELFRDALAVVHRISDLIHRAWEWFLRLIGRRSAATEQSPLEITVVEPALPEPSTPNAKHNPVFSQRDLPLLPSLTLVTGFLIVFPAVLVAGLQRQGVPDLGAIAIYFSTPALMTWVVWEIPYLLPKIGAKPWGGSIITAVFKSGLKVIAAVLVFVFLALALVGEKHAGLLYAGLGLALTGLVFGFISVRLESKHLQNQAPTYTSELETAG